MHKVAVWLALLSALLLGLLVGHAQDGPLTNLANLPIRTDSNGYVLASAQTYTGPDGPRRVLANTLGRTDANGYLILTNPTGFGGAPTDATYLTQTANGTLSAEQAMGSLGTGLVFNTTVTGVQSIYAGSTCTNQFLRALSAAGVGTCATVTLTDTTGLAPSDAQYWVGAANGTLSAEKDLSGFTALVVNTAGTPSAYAGVTCTNQFLRVLSALGAGTCATVSLTADVTGTLPVGNGGTNATTYTAGSVIFAGASGTSLAQDNANLFWDDSGNLLGIGNTSPIVKLDVSADGASVHGALEVFSSTSTDRGIILGRRGRGTRASQSAITSGDILFDFVAQAHDGTAMSDSALIRFQSIGTVATGRRPSVITFWTSPDSVAGPSERLRLHETGGISIGTTTDSAGIGGLTVNAKVFVAGISAGAAGDTDACLNSGTNELTDAGAASCIVSSIRFKDDVRPLSTGLREVLRLAPVSYRYRGDLRQTQRIGLIAEDMEQVEPRLVFFEPDGITPRGISYEESVALLVKAIQDLSAQVDRLQGRLEQAGH